MNKPINLHVVFSKEILNDLCHDLIDEGFNVKQMDTSLDTFSEWAQSDEKNHADCALIYGFELASKGDEYSLRAASYQRLREVRLHRENFRLIVIYPREVLQDKKFISSIAQLGIYDLHFTDQLNIEMIKDWILIKKGLAHVDALLGDYIPDEQEEEYNDPVFQETQEIEEKEEVESEKPRRLTRSRLEERGKTREKGLLDSLRQIAPIVPTSPQPSKVRYEYHSFASKLIVIASTKGGVGKTDIAINLASAIKEKTQINRIAVVDFSFPYGGIASVLRLNREKSLRDWIILDPQIITEEGVNEKVIQYEGIDFVVMPLKINESIKFNRNHAENLISTLRRYYDVIILDSAGFSDLNLVAFERATEIIIVTTSDVNSITNGLSFKKDLINNFGISHEKLSVFLNKVPKVEDIKIDMIAEGFEDDDKGIPVIAYAPFDDVVRQMRNKGVFIYKEKNNHPFSQGIDMVLEAFRFIPKKEISKNNLGKGVFSRIFEKV